MAGGYTAPAAAMTRGIEGGVGILKDLTALQRQPAIEQRAQEEHELKLREGQQRIEASQQEQERRTDVDALKLSEDDLKNIQGEQDALTTKYGSWLNTPAAERAAVGKKYGEWQGRHSKLLEGARANIDRWRSKGQQVSADIAAGKEAKPADLANMIASQTGMNPQALLDGPNGEPSEFRQAHQALAEAGSTGNWGNVVPYANVVLEAELRQGVGTPGKDGYPITSKEIVGFAPAHPTQAGETPGDAVYPVLRIRTTGNPQGYTAPVTENRTSDPNDPPKAVSVSKMIDRLQHYGTLVEALNSPQMKPHVEKGIKEAGDEIDQNLRLSAQIPPSAFAQKMAVTGQLVEGRIEQARTSGEYGVQRAQVAGEAGVEKAGVTAEGRKAVENIRQTGATQRTGMHEAAATQRAGMPARDVTTRLAGVQQMLDDGDIDEAQANVLRQQIVVGGRGGGGAGRGGTQPKLTKDQQDKIVASEAAKYGAYRIKGEWKQWKGTGEPGKGSGYWADATPETLEKVTEIQGRVATQASPNAPGAAPAAPSGIKPPAGKTAAPAGGGGGVYRIKNAADYHALPSGALYLDPNNPAITRRKP